MRILVVTMAAASQFTPIFDRLAERHEVTLLTPPGTGRARARETLHFEPVRSSAPSRRARAEESFRGTAEAVARAVGQAGPGRFDVAFAQASFGCAAGVLDAAPLPVVAHVELPAMEMARARPEYPLTPEDEGADAALRALVEGTVARAALTVVPSRYAASRLAPSLRDRVRVVMEGFDPRPALGPPAGPAERRAARARLGLPEAAPVVGFFGRTLEAVRGFDVFLDAALAIRRREPEALFLAVGAAATLYGNERAYLGEESFRDHALRRAGIRGEEDGFHVLPLQPQETLHALMDCVDCALFPMFENAGNWSFYECLAGGTPTVSSDACFFPEVIRDGRNGFLRPRGDAEAFAEAALRLIGDPDLRARMGAEALRTVVEGHTVRHAAERYEAVLAEAAARR
jgi:glycosyltransferase involved in cell wall biosynthesis